MHFSLVSTTPLGSTLNRLVRKTYMVNFSSRRLYICKYYTGTRMSLLHTCSSRRNVLEVVPVHCNNNVSSHHTCTGTNTPWKWFRASVNRRLRSSHQSASHGDGTAGAGEASRTGRHKQSEPPPTCLQQCRLISARAAKGSNRVRHKDGT